MRERERMCERISVCVCVCLERERERVSEEQTNGAGMRMLEGACGTVVRERECLCSCVRARECARVCALRSSTWRRKRSQQRGRE